MMKLYAMKDVKADCFAAPFAVQTEGVALRALIEGAQQPNSQLAKYPEDFILYEIGTWDPDSGTVAALVPTPKFITTAVAAVQQARAEEEARRRVTEPVLPGISEDPARKVA